MCFNPALEPDVRERDKIYQWLANRDDLRDDQSIGALPEKICVNAWNEDRLCYIHVKEGVARVTQCHVHFAKKEKAYR